MEEGWLKLFEKDEQGEEEIKTAKAASHSLLQMAHKAKDIGAIP